MHANGVIDKQFSAMESRMYGLYLDDNRRKLSVSSLRTQKVVSVTNSYTLLADGFNCC